MPSILKSWGWRNIDHTILTLHSSPLLSLFPPHCCPFLLQSITSIHTRRIHALHLNLQILSTRKRKDVEVADIKVQVCLYAFDCLYQNGEVLVDRPLTERRELLYNSLTEKEGELLFAEAKVSLPPLGWQSCCAGPL